MKPITFILALSFALTSAAQDTFSIVAIDSITGEVGSAGASCLDLYANAPNKPDGFLSKLIPGVGGINTQAAYDSTNQYNATQRMLAGDTPNQIIQWLINNDSYAGTLSTAYTYRQYGVAAFVNNSPQAAGHTGTNTPTYHNNIVGSNYAIQGNTLLEASVLTDMETAFLNAEGNLACKLMAALQGAKRIGADNRCTDNGTSSLFAFIKVAQPTDGFGNPSFSLSVRTHDGAGIEPIDSLQIKFDQVNNCATTSVSFLVDEQDLTLYPNPSNGTINFQWNGYKINAIERVAIIDITGKTVYNQSPKNASNKVLSINPKLKAGIYFIKIITDKGEVAKKIIIQP
ncbi:MAG: DUF1028 domain-containing protein [Flavobacteriales bacterium]|nr:DUF1028 domain-containing protein [Flavobacteriales bacterium]MCB9363367.1 DUF1028 domain-containing protein [Flavobacteriales bacterium]